MRVVAGLHLSHSILQKLLFLQKNKEKKEGKKGSRSSKNKEEMGEMRKGGRGKRSHVPASNISSSLKKSEDWSTPPK